MTARYGLVIFLSLLANMQVPRPLADKGAIDV